MRDASATTQRSRDSRLGLDQLRRRSGRSPGPPTTHIPADLDRNRRGAPSPLAAMVRRSTKLATRSPWRGTGAVGRQAGSARVGTRHSHAIPPLGRRLHRRVGHRGPWRHRAHWGRRWHRATGLKAGEFLLVQSIGSRSHQRRPLVVHGRVGNVMRVMVHRGRRRGCRDMAPPCRCLLPSCGHSAVCAISRGGGRRRSCAHAVRRQTRPTGIGAGYTHSVSARWIGWLRPGWRGKRKRGNHRNAAQEAFVCPRNGSLLTRRWRETDFELSVPGRRRHPSATANHFFTHHLPPKLG